MPRLSPRQQHALRVLVACCCLDADAVACDQATMLAFPEAQCPEFYPVVPVPCGCRCHDANPTEDALHGRHGTRDRRRA